MSTARRQEGTSTGNYATATATAGAPNIVVGKSNDHVAREYSPDTGIKINGSYRS